MSEKLTKDFPAVRAAGRSAKASIAATRLHLEHKMQDEITALRARLAASEETVRGLRGFAQAAVALAQHGRGDMPLLVQCRMRGLLDDKGNPTPLLTGAAAGEGERDVQG